MTLDFSGRAVFPLKVSEEVSVSSISDGNDWCVLEGTSEKGSYDECGKPRCVNWELENCCVFGRDRSGKESCREPVGGDVVELLPLDPFDMGVIATFAAVSSWVDGCEKDILNVFSKDGSICVFDKLRILYGIDGRVEQNGKELELNGCLLCSEKLGIGERALNSCRKDFGNGKECCGASRKEAEMGSVSCYDGNEVDPSDVLPFCFRFLGVQDLLAMESVCKSLRFAAQDDILPWRSIHINQNLSEKITNDTLMLLSNKAQGHLQSLSLVDCRKITDNGLKSVLDRNPRLTKGRIQDFEEPWARLK